VTDAAATGQQYRAHVERSSDARHARATIRQFTLDTGVRRGDAAAGPNAVETLLTALGTCLLTSLAMVADASKLDVRAASVDLTASRQDRPPRVTGVEYVLRVDCPAADERVAHLIDLAERNSTVLGSLRGGSFPITGRWERARATAGEIG